MGDFSFRQSPGNRCLTSHDLLVAVWAIRYSKKSKQGGRPVKSSDRNSNTVKTAKTAEAENAIPDAADMGFEKLLVAARAGSADAAGELVARYRAYLLKIAGDRIAPELRQKVGVSDVVQESMLTAHRILDRFQGNSEAQWKAWLKTIVGNDIGDLQRRFRGAAKRDLRREMGAPNPHSSAPSFDIRRPGPGPRTEATMNEDTLRLNAALERLSAEYRQVIRLRNWEQLSYEDIGQRMGKSAEATAQALDPRSSDFKRKSVPMSDKERETPADGPTVHWSREHPREETHTTPAETSISGGSDGDSPGNDVDPEITNADQLFQMMERARAFEQRLEQTLGRDANAPSPPGKAVRPADESAPTETSTDYEIIREIARGGMGVVYEAWQHSLSRRVALKVILGAQLRSSSEIARFRAEAEAVAKLDHPGVVPIYEIGELDNTQFFSMGLYPKGSLVDQYATERPNPREAARIVAEVAEAMQFAHSRNIIHRDLKPGNVLLDDNGQAKITDFGLAKDAEKDSGLTLSGTILGTPAYMAPEQARGQQESVGQAADIYALGGILFFLLTGEPPFVGETPLETIQQVIAVEPRSPASIEPNVDRDLSTVALKCLQKAPEKRYASAQDVANDLGRWLRHEPINARPVSRLERTSKWIRRNPVVSGLLAATGTLLTATIIGGIVYQSQLNAAPGAKPRQRGKRFWRPKRQPECCTSR